MWIKSIAIMCILVVVGIGLATIYGGFWIVTIAIFFTISTLNCLAVF